MKIIALSFKNLNSLKGEFTIDFDSSPLAYSGLYAITGPTGAGKTTILDAITVALYNKVPRHGANVEELMTRHTGECRSEVTFEANGKKYRSLWTLNRARNKPGGKFQPDKMELADAETGELIGGHRKTETLQAIVQITGLDYDQFLRSVMLAQGEFSRFLKASTRERSELLEQMTDSFIFSRISMFVFEKAKAEKLLLEKLNDQMNQVVWLSDAELEALLQEQQSINRSLEKNRETEKQLRQQLELLAAKEKLEVELTQVEAKLDEWKQEGITAQDEYEQLRQHLLAAPFAPQVSQWRSSEDQLEALQAEVEAAKNELLQQSKAEASEHELVALRRQNLEEAVASVQKWMPVIEKAQETDNRIIILEGALAKTTTEIDALEQQQDNLQQQIQEAATEQARTKLALVAVTQWLQTHETSAALAAIEPELYALANNRRTLLDAMADTNQRQAQLRKELKLLQNKMNQNSDTLKQLQALAEAGIQKTAVLKQQVEQLTKAASPNELEAELRNMPRQLAALQQMHELAKEYQTLMQRSVKGLARIEETKALIEANKTAFIQTEQLCRETEGHLATLEALLQKEKLIHKYEAERLTLVEGEPCPLCGALHHPFATSPPAEQMGQLLQQVAEQQQKTQNLKAACNRLDQEAYKLQNDFQSFQELLRHIQSDADAKSKQFAGLVPLAGFTGNIAPVEPINMQLTAMQMQLEQKEAQYKAIQAASHAWEQAKAANKEVEQQQQLQQQQATQYKELYKKMQQDIAAEGLKLQKHTAALQQCSMDIDALLSGQPWYIAGVENEDLLQRFAKEKNTYQQQATNEGKLRLQQQLQQQALMHLEGNALQVAERLKVLNDEVTELTNNLNTLRAERFRLLGNTSVAAAKEQWQTAERQARQNLANAEAVFAQTQQLITATKARLKALQQQRDALQTRVNNIKLQLQQEVQQAGFETVEQVEAALLPAEKAAHLQQQKRQWEYKGIELRTLQQQLLQSRQTLQQQPQPEKDLAQLQEELQQLLALQDELHRQLGIFQRRLSEDTEKREAYASKAKARAVQQATWARWENLNRIIGSATGEKFRSFAQGLTLQHLTALANRHLAVFNPRYRLEKRPGDTLDLEVTDSWQADVARPISTLSGGETFLVSLSLALGLSDLASHKVQIQSLFIDEGFGTLDAETLDVAMDALENLRESGKSIGVISHVEAMKERIPTQIQVIRTSGGNSRIAIIG
jgi:exonuclease SbcC